MFTDLFLALANKKNARGHPILSALAYAFCPAAARWWLAGAEPQPVFDPVWQALTDLASGGTLASHLTRYGFSNLLDEMKRYVEEVQVYRLQHKVQAPETLPTFRGGRLPSGRRFGSENAIQNLGGDWKNLFGYVRAWAFLAQDWRSGLGLQEAKDCPLSAETVHLTLPETRLPVAWPVWVWKLQVGHVVETRIGLLVQNGEQDQLRFAMLRRCNPTGNQPWPNTPAVYALDRCTGLAQPYDPTITDKQASGLIQRLAEIAKGGPCPPLPALTHPDTCTPCGYRRLCYHNHDLLPNALQI